MNKPLKIFIGSGEASLLERKVFHYSILQNSNNCEVIIYNGTHDTLEYDDGRIERLNTPLDIKYQNVTEFSNFRWFIPEICQFQGRAVYVDSDMICFGDLGIFRDIEMQGCHVMARSNAYSEKGKWGYDPDQAWGLSMCLIDCEKFHFKAEQLFQDISAGHFSYHDLHYMKPPILEYLNLKLCDLPPGWNEFDTCNKDTQLIHYTNLLTQPWKFPAHKYGGLWFRWLREAIDAGFISMDEVSKSIGRGYVRPNIMMGNWVPAGNHPVRDIALTIPWAVKRFNSLLHRTFGRLGLKK